MKSHASHDQLNVYVSSPQRIASYLYYSDIAMSPVIF